MSNAMLHGCDGGSANLITKSITANGTYQASSDNADGYSEVSVNVPPTLFRQLVDGSITTVTEDDLAGITELFTAAFYAKPQLKSVIIPTTITQCYNDTFRHSSALTKVVFLRDAPPTMSGANWFVGTNANGKIYVPYAHIDDYKIATNYTYYASKIFPLVSMASDLSNIDTTTYTKACVIGIDKSYKEYTYDGLQWNEVV